ncbi:hypothetical protein ACFLSX_00710 [Calditrichota bacterium]
MSLVLAPIVDGKQETWKQWANDLKGSKAEEFKDFNTRYGLTRHSAWLAETPTGTVVAALHEGPGADNFMSKVATSDHQFDVLFKQRLKEFHNMDFSKPLPGSPPQLLINAVK